MSLKDGSQKMSKSDPSDYSRINLTDNADTIHKKIKKATTDSCDNLVDNLQNRPEIKNLINIYAAMKNIDLEKACSELGNESCSSFKEKLAELLIAKILPIRNKIMELMQDTAYIKQMIAAGNEKAVNIAGCSLKEIKKIVAP
jgi:tryptophanyl-tRNA synthetase